MHAVKTLHAEVPEHICVREPPDAAPWLLVPSSEEVSDAVIDMVIDGAIGRQARAIAEIRRPTGQKPVQSAAHRRPCALVAGLEQVAILVLIRWTLFLDGLAPGYQWPSFQSRCGPNV